MRLKYIDENQYINIQGSPFLFNNFREGVVILKTDTAFKVPLRYDIYSDIFEYKIDEKVFGVGNKKNIKEIILENMKFVYYENKGNVSFNGYYQLYKDGKCILLSKRKVLFKEKKKGDGIRPDEPAKFVSQKEQFYIINKEAYPQLIRNKKDLIKCFSDRTDSIKQFLKKYKVSLGKSEYLLSIIDYYEEL